VKRAVVLLAAAAVVVTAGGWVLAVTWHLSFGAGLYCSLGTASTAGCNPGLSTAGKAAAAGVMLLAIPLLAACFSLLTGHHAGRRAAERAREHVTAAEKRIAEEADRRHVIMQRHVERLLAGHCADIKEHVSLVAEGPARGGAGSNPAGAGLNAESAGSAAPAGPLVPPPATSDALPLIKTGPKTAGRRRPKGAT
jgi:hypothetical protein